MAKQLKTIQCPQCGSADSTQLEKDYYKCNNCGTHYFLDNDDVNINVNHRFPTPAEAEPRSKTGIIIGLSVFGLAIVIVIFLSFLASNNDKSQRDANIRSFDETSYLRLPIVANNKLCMLKMVYKSNDKEFAFQFIDPLTGKSEAEKRIDGLKAFSFGSNKDFARLADGATYIILEKRIYRIPNNSTSVEDVTTSLFEGDPLYTSGIAEIEYYGKECFKIMTNTGQLYFYAPVVKKSYTEREIGDAAYDLNTLLPQARDSTMYAFSDSDIWDDKIKDWKLYKIIYKYNAGGPNNVPSPEVGFTSKKLSFRTQRIVSYTELTPERRYFYPHVLAYDKDHLFIWVRVSAAKDSGRLLQRIDTNTGELLWSLPVENLNGRYQFYYKNALYANKKFIMQISDDEYILVSEDGKLEKRFQL